MSLLHMDFPSGQTGLYGTDESFLTNGLYAEAGSAGTNLDIVDDPDPVITGNVIRFANNVASVPTLRFIRPSSNTTAGRACRIWLDRIPTGSNDQPTVHDFRDGSNSSLIRVRVNTAGALIVHNSAGTEIGATANSTVVANAWQHVEVKIFVSTTVGTVEIRVEGITKLSLTGLNISANPVAQTASYFSGSNFAGGLMYQKDLVEWDGAGSVNNNFLGSVQVRELLTESDVSFLWAASTGSTGFNLLDEAPPNDDTDYIYAINPPPGASLFGITDLPADVTSVKGLYAVVRSTKTDGGDGNLQVGIKSGSSTGLGTDRPVTTAYTYWTDMFELDPATSAAWTRVGVNAAQLQLNRTV